MRKYGLPSADVVDVAHHAAPNRDHAPRPSGLIIKHGWTLGKEGGEK